MSQPDNELNLIKKNKSLTQIKNLQMQKINFVKI